jgi:hypothetical protein
MPKLHKRKETKEMDVNQGCQMVYYQTNNPNLGKFWRVLQLKMLVYFMAFLSIFRPCGIFYGNLESSLPFWYIFPRFGMLLHVLVYYSTFWFITPRFGILLHVLV